MDTHFAITDQNRNRTAGVGASFAAIHSFGIRYFVDSVRDERVYEGTWEALAGIETVFFSLSRDWIRPVERDFIIEARARGFATGLLWDVPGLSLKTIDCEGLFDYLIQSEKWERAETPKSIGLVLGERGSQEGFAEAGAELVVRVPRGKLESLQRNRDELRETISELTEFAPAKGSLLMDDLETIPHWLVLELIRKVSEKETDLILVRSGRHVQAEDVADLRDELKSSWRKSFPRKVIVLGERESASGPLERAVRGAVEYDNESGEAEIVDAESLDYGWRWSGAFEEARNRPNTFLVLEDGSVFGKRAVDLRGDFEVIASLGGGLSFGHQSNRLFSKLGAGFCVLADDPLSRLVEHLEVDSYLDQMNFLVPIDRDDRVDSAKRVVEGLLEEGVSVAEVSRRMGLNRSTIHRWLKSWKDKA